MVKAKVRIFICAISACAFIGLFSGCDMLPLTSIFPPEAPGGLVVRKGSSTLNLRWVDNSLIETGYVVERSIGDDTHFSVLDGDLPSNTTSYSDISVATGLTYWYRVAARNDRGASSYSDQASGRLEAVTGAIIADHTVINKVRLDQIPLSAIEAARVNVHIAYDHTSHGAQLIGGMTNLPAFKEANGGTHGLYGFNNGGIGGVLDLKDNFSSASDLHDYPGWIYATRKFLGWRCNTPEDYSTGTPDYNSSYNVVMWSWCWAEPYAAYVNRYLAAMDQLRADYPQVTFVYMTWRSQGTGEWQAVQEWNQYIRQYCIDNKLVLYDFYDIEVYDPDGKYFADKRANEDCSYDNAPPYTEGPLNGNWAIEWQSSHVQGRDWYNCDAPHTQPLNSNLKAYAAWWLWARLGGWDGN